MILAVDVQYSDRTGLVAGVLFNNWTDSKPFKEYLSIIDDICEYESGQFYKRELPCILKLINEHSISPTVLVIDGYVFLDGINKVGLGKRLYDCLDGNVKVIGVAKNAFMGITTDFELYRGESKKPLYITCIGEDLAKAKECISMMHGFYRMPTLLRRADQLCRQKI